MVIYVDAKKTFAKIAHPLQINILSNWRVVITFIKFRVPIRNLQQTVS